MLLAPPAASGGDPTLDATRKSRKGGQIKGSFAFASAVRLQRVDGRRLDAFVADLHCSRVHRGAAPIVSYVSALPVRLQVCECAFVRVRVHVRVLSSTGWFAALRSQGSDYRFL